MEAKEMQATKRLLKKLSALRATLSDDERALLDGFIVTPRADDVAAHILKDAISPAVTPRADDVAAHVLKDAISPAVTPRADDVAAHVLKGGITPAVTPATQPGPHPRFDVVYDPEKQIYKIA